MMGSKEVEMLLLATIKIIDSAKKANDPDNIGAEVLFISKFIETLVSRTLTAKPVVGTSNKQHVELMKASYGRLKFGIKEAVALGFAVSMQKFSKNEIEFVCQIYPVPEAKNTTSH
jgi:hypothetical protein